MNGVRRFLGGGGGSGSTTPTTPSLQLSQEPSTPPPPPPLNQPAPSSSSVPSTAPLFITGKPSWPPTSPPQTPSSEHAESPKMTTAALFFRKDKQRPPPIPSSGTMGDLEDGVDVFNGNGQYSPSPPPFTTAAAAAATTSMRHSNGHNHNGIVSPTRSQSSLTLSSPIAGPSSPRIAIPTPPLPHRVSQLSRKSVNGGGSSNNGGGSEWTNGKRHSGSGVLGVRDDLLMSLLASEAIVDSRGYEVLSAEEVDELKKEHQVLSSRLIAMNKKLTLETKIRDAASSLSKANASYKNVSKQTSEQLENANRKVDLAQKELWKVSERANEIQRKLLEHRASVLSYSVRSLEKKVAPSSPDGGDLTTTTTNSASGYSTPNRSSQMMSPAASSVTSVLSSSSKGRFDGAHFFAGHSDAIVPQTPRAPPSSTEIADLEEKLRTATAALDATTAKQTELTRELSLLRLEKEQVQTSLAMELQSAEDTIATLEKEAGRMEEMEEQLQLLEGEREVWLAERRELEERRREVDTLESRLEVLEERSGEATEMENVLAREREVNRVDRENRENELNEMKLMWEADRAAWEVERATVEGEISEMLTKLRQAETQGESKTELDAYFDRLGELVQTHGILLVSREATIPSLLSSVGAHLEGLDAKLEAHAHAQEEWASIRSKLEEDIRSGLDKREALYSELDQARRERDEARTDARNLETELKEQSYASLAASQLSNQNQPAVEYTGDAAKIVAVLQPVWAILPSPEARAGKTGSRFRTGSPTSSPVASRSGSSLSEMDVRSLKTLYDPRGLPSLASNGSGSFTVEAFVERVQALITDDRALIERLVRFAQAHDLLKKNAERAQKLAQESNSALETYQKQVKLLESRNLAMVNKQAALQDEIQHLQDSIDRITAEKLEVETLAAEQAETCRQLTDANNTLSARALNLAEESASASDGVRKKLEAQLAECNAALSRAKAEVDSMHQSQQAQQMALMEELNSVQTENDNLRAQLRAKK